MASRRRRRRRRRRRKRSRLDQVLVRPAGWIKARRIQRGGNAMPFDGSAVPARSPLAILLEADRKLTSERRAAAKLHPKPAPSAESVAWTGREVVSGTSQTFKAPYGGSDRRSFAWRN